MNFLILKQEDIRNLYESNAGKIKIDTKFFSGKTIKKNLLTVLLKYGEDHPEELIKVINDYTILQSLSDDKFEQIHKLYCEMSNKQIEIVNIKYELEQNLNFLFRSY